MKKVFSLIAFVAALVACQPEKVKTAFEVPGAVATVQVSVVNIADQKPILGAQFNSNKTTLLLGSGVSITDNVQAGTVVLSTEKSKGIAVPIDVIVTCTYEGKEYDGSVEVQALPAGSQANYTVLILVGEDPIDYKFEVNPTLISVNEEIAYFTPDS